jgi:hypothetical protein
MTRSAQAAGLDGYGQGEKGDGGSGWTTGSGRTDDVDAVLILSQDQDSSEVADEVRRITRDQGR